MRDDLLVRCFKSPVVNFGEEVVQIVVPKTCSSSGHETCAHCGLSSSHQATGKTFDRVTSTFY